MEDWHSFAWDGRDMFGSGTLDRPWLDAGWTRWTPPG
jgi:xylose isomerase